MQHVGGQAHVIDDAPRKTSEDRDVLARPNTVHIVNNTGGCLYQWVRA